ncbi:flagellar hook-associated protein 1 FlgK [Motilibacter peucedani]|uniref:Flagellar hook-associated protein 1 n=1 Tax=Motilibacter peucedani TaxID=598650 RepID=A0A420XTI5_9ACTN|nr:flagellar hook-associated protein FlgK [Motilibacter peucedani]RKS80172.1 flagellar hook-associated protein 1 FlgK [Motilibacter peucedani]
MGSTFGGINTAYTGLVAQRRALEVTGQNVANANTPGYSRQRVTMQSQGAGVQPAVYSRYEGAGDGVAVTGVERITDGFQVARQQVEHGNYSAADTHAATLKDIEGTFAEPSENGIQESMQDLYNAFAAVGESADPSASGPRATLLQAAQGVTDKLHDASTNLDQQWSTMRTTLDNSVAEINTTTQTIADLNLAIKRNTQAGVPANELADRRDQLVLKLSDSIGAVGRPGEDGVVDVLVGGSPLVSGVSASALSVKGNTNPNQLPPDPPRVTWGMDGTSLSVTTGTVGGLLTGMNKTIPSYKSSLDSVAASLASTVNAIHRTGYDTDPTGDPATGGEGRDFFGPADGTTTTPVTAANITVRITDPAKIAASATPGGNKDGSVMSLIANASDAADGPMASYKSLIGNLGVESQTAQTRLTTRKDVATKADEAVGSTSGVDTDEELTNLLGFQRAYESAAKILSTLDSSIETIINMVRG